MIVSKTDNGLIHNLARWALCCFGWRPNSINFVPLWALIDADRHIPPTTVLPLLFCLNKIVFVYNKKILIITTKN